METNETILQVDALMGQLKTLLPLKPADEKRLWEKFRLEFNYNSNHIEGNTLTYGQTEMLLLFDKSIGDVPVSDLEEMKAHDVAFSQIKQFALENEWSLTEQFIREINKTILVEPFWKEAITFDGIPTRKKIEIGVYKTSPNSVRLKNGSIHEYASPEETPAKMHELIEWYRSSESTMHPIRLAALFHYRFVCIHPFDDGNGRVARLVMNYILMKSNLPPVIIKSEDKEAYLTALQKSDFGDTEAIVDYIALQLNWSVQLNIKAAKGEELFETGDIEKEIAILKREKLTRERIFKTPKTVYELARHIEKDVWPKLEKTLSNFDDFFTESKTSVYIDHHKKMKRFMITNWLSLTPEYALWGYDLEGNNIESILWQHKKMGLKSASKLTDCAIDCSLYFGDEAYNLSIDIDNKAVFKDKKEYKSFYMSSDVEQIVRLVSSQLLLIIKETK